ncbi:hypothetical protein BKA64DRAFT_754013 [Cadophora sp. MPI-SDFR-AT-0126]|nr:hypothetical protein BKA64DRAFT_754013 [Leotiomycetes sp. MPI-SDFR-AT-0126]
MNRATISMLDPGTPSISFKVKTLLVSCSRGSSRLISASAKELPSSGLMTNISFKQNGDTVTYTADVLVPYAFVRLFIGRNQPSPGIGRGWPIDDVPNVINDIYDEIVNYLVEGNEFYSGFYEYTGTWYETSKNDAVWSWSPIGTAPQHQSGYTYTWNVPFAGIDAVASEYVIQGQGYAPVKNVFMGQLRMYAHI